MWATVLYCPQKLLYLNKIKNFLQSTILFSAAVFYNPSNIRDHKRKCCCLLKNRLSDFFPHYWCPSSTHQWWGSICTFVQLFCNIGPYSSSNKWNCKVLPIGHLVLGTGVLINGHFPYLYVYSLCLLWQCSWPTLYTAPLFLATSYTCLSHIPLLVDLSLFLSLFSF